MCLGVPGKVIDVSGNDPLYRTAKVACGGVIKEIALAGVPDAKVGEYVIVHAGFAIGSYDEETALATLRDLEEIARASGDEGEAP